MNFKSEEFTDVKLDLPNMHSSIENPVFVDTLNTAIKVEDAESLEHNINVVDEYG